MNESKITGRILQALPLRTGTSKAGNQWQVQEYILETLGEYPKKVCFEVFGDNVDKYPMQVGQEVTAFIDIESREFNGRWYTSVRAWKVESGVTLPEHQAQQEQAPATAKAKTPPQAPVQSDALPF